MNLFTQGNQQTLRHPDPKPDMPRPGTPQPGDIPGTPRPGDMPPTPPQPGSPGPVNPKSWEQVPELHANTFCNFSTIS